MQKLSLRKLSLVGLSLMAVSAVTAAFMPSKNTNRVASNGTLRGDISNDGGAAVNTCTFRQDANSCNATAGSLTTGVNQTNSYTELGYQTANNTTVGDI
ncbi:hypothetical protein A3860_07660 [Niastella vici]|uniref:Uncharacterized protein n=1 Tax=Niastella vici TaxID=1703345 RepID=A0A1V9FIM1_9BACT|nr:hypothetical protein [Niastella vici]OQP58192.1 hypothetical protein A3860_07660 [Niastella vici]